MRRPIALLSLFAVACGAAPPPTASTRPAPAPLVVSVVYDQLGSWVLAEHLARLDPEGAIRRTAARGQYVHAVAYGYAGTYTAPGHAAIYSGAAPWQSQVPSNRVWDRARRARLSTMDDGEHAILGRTGAFASPRVMAAETVADVLERTSGGAAITISLAMKDRSAVLPGGQHPDACMWLDPRAGGFTTSTWYASELPAWVAAFDHDHPFAATYAPWVPEDPASLAALGPDDQTGEGAYGWGPTFPHDPSAPEAIGEPDAYLSTPASTEHLLALAAHAVRALHAGDDAQPDLLAISIATTDYVGHAFGPESWEYVDALVRVDRALGHLLAALEREHGAIAVLLTADHGVAPLVERAREHGHAGAVRWTSEAELALLRTHLAEALGAPPTGEWIEAWVQPYVYLPASVRDGADRERVVTEASAWLAARPGVARVIDVRRGAALRASADPIERLIGQSISDTPPGELYVVPSEWSVAEEELPAEAGTSHGSPYDYDRQVPVIFSGPGVTHGETTTDGIEQARVASTIARLLGIEAPALAAHEPLPGSP
jgi:hypothetical protein